MDDLISRQAVLEATSTTLKITGKENAETVYEYIKKLCDDIKALPSAQPELIKDTIQKFHDYQVEWLTSHCDLEFEPVLESWVVRFLHDTANCYMMEAEHD